MTEYDSARAAEGRRKIWQGHDQRDRELCQEGAYLMFDEISDAGEDELWDAAKRIQASFWLADEAEQYQGDDSELEKWYYNYAGDLIEDARSIVGLETESVEYTMDWWKAYRHRDMEALEENIYREHAIQLEHGNGDMGKVSEQAERLTDLLIEASHAHGRKEWDEVDDVLETYFEVYEASI